jgi:hypothetical protein
MKTKKEHIETITAEEFDRRFDEGEDISRYIDWSKATRPGLEIKRMSLDLPAHMLEKLDRESALRGVTRQSLVKMWLYEKLTHGEQGDSKEK